MTFDKSVNVLVGENESGKSTILDAINIVLNQKNRNSDKYIIKDMLNTVQVSNFMDNPKIENLPEIKIELRFEFDDDYKEPYVYFGENNLHIKDENEVDFGILFECKFDCETFGDMLRDQIEEGEIPYEYYLMTWTTFQGSPYKIMKKPLNCIIIDTSESDTSNSFNYFNKTLFNSKYSDTEKMNAKNRFRCEVEKIFEKLDLVEIDDNRKFGPNNKKIILDSVISVFENGIPLENKGAGMENLIKTQIALDKGKSNLDVVMIEEPENHLCHANLMKMLEEIKSNIGKAQLILTTHSNMIVSKLNLNNAIWLSEQTSVKLDSIDGEVAKFFEKADNNNFLQLLLAKKVILVEGATEYLLIPDVYFKKTGKSIEEDEVSIISCNGISYKNYLKIAESTNKKVAVITDNDKKDSNIKLMDEFNKEHILQHIFMDKEVANWTWEVCLYNENQEMFDEKIKISKGSKYLFHDKNYGQVLGKMLNNKVETAYQILTDQYDFEVPQYVKDAIEWIRK